MVNSNDENKGIFMFDYLYITVFGDKFTGKTSLVNRITQDVFKDNYRMSLNTEHTPHTVYINTESGAIPIDILFSDTPGQYSLAANTHNMRVDALLLLFDITNLRSFEELAKWCNKMIKMKKAPRPMVIIGNKVDLDVDRIIMKDQVFDFIEKFRKSWHFRKYEAQHVPIKYLELSVKESSKEVFDTIIGYLAGESYKLITRLNEIKPTEKYEWQSYY